MSHPDNTASPGPLDLTAQEAALLRRAAEGLVAAAAHHKRLSLDDYALGRLADHPVVGVFVTLRKRGELRACIGNFAAAAPLGPALERAAVGVVRHDPRFPPVTPQELPDLQISISLLHSRELLGTTPQQRAAQIEIGRHGLDIELRGNKGLLLPSVATDFGWDEVSFLRAVCRKAGLSEDAWHDPEAMIYRFCAIQL